MKAQIAAEFILYTVLAMSIVIISLAGLSKFFADSKDEKALQELTQFGRSLQKELIVASQVKAGYIRYLSIPQSVLGNDYTISNDDFSFTLNYKDYQRVFQTPKLSGVLNKGENKLVYDGTQIIIS